ncbi:MAG: recombinase family protein [Planctomycetota bacterium]|nr:recombinase family protein [Planctomycetota bacterium]
MVELANLYLTEAAALPRRDIAPLEAEIRTTITQRDRLAKYLEREGETDLDPLVETIRKNERKLKDLRGQLTALKAQNEPPPPPLTLAEVVAMVADLHNLLAQDVAVAAPLLRELTGPVVVDQVIERGQARPSWIARFSINLVPVVAKLTASRHCPTSPTWE